MADNQVVKWPARDTEDRIVMVVDGVEYDRLEAKIRMLEGTLRLCSDYYDKMRESMEEWRALSKTASNPTSKRGS